MAVIGYVDSTEALAYIQLRYDTSITEEELSRGLYQAFDKIELVDVRYTGKELEGGDNFPRICDEEVPENVKQAQMLEGFDIASGKDKIIEEISKGVKSKSIGDMSKSYDTSFKVGQALFSNQKAATIMQMYERKTYGKRMSCYGY